MVTAERSEMTARIKRTAKNRLLLRLYVAGNAPNSICAVSNARTLCEEHFAPFYHLEIVDLLESPRRALADGIIVTPTLLKLSPLPAQRVIGNLSDTKHLLSLLGGR
jgi:circadian clock protein KaiB